MQNFDRIAAMAAECGFTNWAPLDVSTLEFRQDVRDMCNADKCDRYDTTWSCPPACGTLDEMRGQAAEYAGGIIVQTVGDLEDSYDWEGIMDTGKRQKENFARMWDEIEMECGDVLALGTGACMRCDKCTYPDAPCRFPDRMEVSMEARGLFVSKVCTDNGLAYNYGPNKIAFTACFLWK